MRLDTVSNRNREGNPEARKTLPRRPHSAHEPDARRKGAGSFLTLDTWDGVSRAHKPHSTASPEAPEIRA